MHRRMRRFDCALQSMRLLPDLRLGLINWLSARQTDSTDQWLREVFLQSPRIKRKVNL